MYLKNTIFIVGLVGLLCLSGCAQRLQPSATPVNFTVKTPAQRSATVRQIIVWRASGAFSIQQARESHIATYQWTQFGVHHYRIDITSTLGLYRLSIRHSAHHVTLWKNGACLYRAATAENLMQKAVGWSLPVGEMRDWIKGVPERTQYAAKYDRFGHLVLLQQAGWTVNYGSYVTVYRDIDLPQVITMKRPRLHIKIVIKKWMLQ